MVNTGKLVFIHHFPCACEHNSQLQGLGKTVTTIALLVSNKVESDRGWKRVEVDLGASNSWPKRRKSAFGHPTPGDSAAACSLNPSSSKPGTQSVCKAVGRGQSGNFVQEWGEGRQVVERATEPGASSAGTGSGLAAGSADASAGRGGPASATTNSGSGVLGRHIPSLPDGGTLIVAPTSLLTQWESEINSKVRVNIGQFHGQGAVFGVLLNRVTQTIEHAVILCKIGQSTAHRHVPLLRSQETASVAANRGQ
jgi:hypothetical protein